MKLVQFFNNLKTSQKLLMISLSFSLPIAVLLYLLIDSINYDIQFSQYELYGDRYQRPLEKLLQAIPEHNTLLAEYAVKSSSPLNAGIQNKEREVDEAMAELAQVDKELGETLQFTDEGLQKRQRTHFRAGTVAQEWQELKSNRDKLSLEALAEKHQHLKNDIRTMITHMGDTSNLILDPDLDSYYTMDVTLLALPQTQDRMAEIIDAGWRALRSGTIGQSERIKMAIYGAQLKEDMDRINQSLQTAFNEDRNFYGIEPHFQKIIPPALESYNVKTVVFIKMIQEIVDAPSTSITADQFVEAGLAARTESFNLWDRAADGEDSLLVNRTNTFKTQRLVYLLLTLLSLAVSVFLAIAITRSITKSLMIVLDNLKAQAAMDFSKKIDLDRSDELGEMAQGINKVVGTLRSTIQRIIDSSKSLANSAQTWAVASVELSQISDKNPALQEMTASIKEVAKNASDLAKLSQQFKLK
ncbi:MAG: hypothetical protein HY308_08185 [Gammaproteobacteria bacterium]|nr:hypothetical protein [Gammaproteobacteria bacterium]